MVSQKTVRLLLLLALSACAKEPEYPPVVHGDPPSSYRVFFDWDSAVVPERELRTIRSAASQCMAIGERCHITMLGHDDKTGTASYNMALSIRRANAVRAIAVREGIPMDRISIVGKGEAEPLLPTPDGIREPQNRSVEMEVR